MEKEATLNLSRHLPGGETELRQERFGQLRGESQRGIQVSWSLGQCSERLSAHGTQLVFSRVHQGDGSLLHMAKWGYHPQCGEQRVS